MPNTAKLERALNSSGVPFSYDRNDIVRVHLSEGGPSLTSRATRLIREAGYELDAAETTRTNVDLVYKPATRGGLGGML